jgi:chalcone synthase
MAPPSGEVEAVQVSHALGGLQPRCQARADGPACVLGMGMANPPTEILQEGYPDRFFDITNSSDKLALKAKFKRICKPSRNLSSSYLSLTYFYKKKCQFEVQHAVARI